MAIRTYKVTLDSKNTIAPEPVFLRQGDKTGAVAIDATLMDNGAPISLSGLTPMFKANTADGRAVIADSTGFNIVNSSGGEFTYQVPNALSSVPGKITTAYFSFSDSSGSESTFDVAFIIKKAVDITKPQANDYITIIDGTLDSLRDQMDSLKIDFNKIINNYNQGDFYNKSETDSKDAATLASAKSYADTGDAATLASAKSWVDKDNYYTKSEVNTKLDILISDTGWVKVALMNGGDGDISVRLRDGVIYHKGWFSNGAQITGGFAVFKYPDSFGDMSDFGERNSTWAAFAHNGHGNYGYIEGATKAFWCKVNDNSGRSVSVSSITFKL